MILGLLLDLRFLNERAAGGVGTSIRRHSHSFFLGIAVRAASTIRASADLADGNPCAIHISSAARNAAPSAGPLARPRRAKSAARSGNFGACQRAGSVDSACQRGSVASSIEWLHAIS